MDHNYQSFFEGVQDLEVYDVKFEEVEDFNYFGAFGQLNVKNESSPAEIKSTDPLYEDLFLGPPLKIEEESSISSELQIESVEMMIYDYCPKSQEFVPPTSEDFFLPASPTSNLVESLLSTPCSVDITSGFRRGRGRPRGRKTGAPRKSRPSDDEPYEPKAKKLTTRGRGRGRGRGRPPKSLIYDDLQALMNRKGDPAPVPLKLLEVKDKQIKAVKKAVPENKKDEEYNKMRLKNTEAARKCREKGRIEQAMIKERLGYLEIENQKNIKEIAIRDATIASCNARIALLEAEIAELRARYGSY